MLSSSWQHVLPLHWSGAELLAEVVQQLSGSELGAEEVPVVGLPVVALLVVLVVAVPLVPVEAS